jgi:hypothetical protein
VSAEHWINGDSGRGDVLRVRLVINWRIWRIGVIIVMGDVLNRADLAAARVRLRTMTGTERDAYEAEIVGTRGGKDRRLNLANMRARLVARCMLGDDGQPLFNYRNPADIDELGSMDAAGLDRVFSECQHINGLTERDIEELEGKSKAGLNGVSGSN